MQMNNEINSDLNRRDFISGGSFATLMMLMGGVPLHAADDKSVVNADGSTNYKAEAAPVNVGIIGCGLWAREILKTLALLPNAPVVALCEPYAAYLKRAVALAPQAAKYKDHKELLADKNVEAVIVCTPTHLHKDIVIEALKAGKHVYCEAPLGTTVEDLAAIAKAVKECPKLNFQPGLQSRADKQIYSLYDWRVKPGNLGKLLTGRMQFNKKQSWRIASPNVDREAEINWRLDKSLSLGLPGEIGIHQMDIANWYVNALPVAITGFGALVHWTDGRDVADTVRVLIEYPGGVSVSFESTIGNSFEGELGVLYGTDSAIMMRERKAWMFKEADAPVLGWEVYSKREEFYRESGLVLGAGATKQESRKVDRFEAADAKSPLQYSLEAFLVNSHNLSAGVKDFIETYGDGDEAALLEYLKDQAKNRVVAPSLRDGFQATLTAIKANEAVTKGQRIVCAPEWFEV